MIHVPLNQCFSYISLITIHCGQVFTQLKKIVLIVPKKSFLSHGLFRSVDCAQTADISEILKISFCYWLIISSPNCLVQLSRPNMIKPHLIDGAFAVSRIPHRSVLSPYTNHVLYILLRSAETRCDFSAFRRTQELIPRLQDGLQAVGTHLRLSPAAPSHE